MSILNPPSEEQKKVIELFKNYNVSINAVAGSGKSTTAFHIAKTYNNPTLLLTYNSKLKFECRKKAELLGLKNLEVHSYHSFCVKYYYNKAFIDLEIKKILENKISPIRKFKFDHILLDECQDMTQLYFRLVQKIINDNNNPIKLCVFGDLKQCIFEFNGADSRFLKYAKNIFRITNQNKSIDWKSITLSTSYRLTKEMADFVNKCILNEDKIISIKNGIKPKYIITNCFGNDGSLNDFSYPYLEIKKYLEQYSYDQIFVSAPTLKSNKIPARLLANKLSEEGIPVYVPNSDDEKIDEDLLKKKLCFSTFHQAKGLERKVVLIFGIDDSYFKFYNKDANYNECPNEIYVALTRASEKMSILHHYQNDYLPFIKKNELKRYTNFIQNDMIDVLEIYDKEKIDTPVTDLLRFMRDDIILNALNFINIKKINEREEVINIPIKTEQDGLFESVSEINGVAIPAYFEFLNKGTMSITKKQIYDLTIEDLLKLANEYCASRTKYTYKLLQIKKYDWLSENNLKKCISRLQKIISKNAVFEHALELSDEKELINRKIIGSIDCIDNNNIYEFKCTKEISNDHYIQLAIYMYLYETALLENFNDAIDKVTRTDIKDNLQEKISAIKKKYEQERKYYLFNIFTNEIYEIKSTLNKLKEMMGYLIKQKYFTKINKSDKDFIEEMNNLKVT